MSRSRSVSPLAVSVSHAAELLDCSRMHIYKLVERGALRLVHVTGSSVVRVPMADIYAALSLDMPDDLIRIGDDQQVG